MNALALVKHAFDECEQSASFFSKVGPAGAESAPRNIEILPPDIQFLHGLLKGELQRCRALADIDRLREESKATGTKPAVPLVRRLNEYPAEGVDLGNLVVYPPEVEPIPVKPLFLDVAFNHINYPAEEEEAKVGGDTTQKAAQAAAPQKRGWFGFGRS